MKLHLPKCLLVAVLAVIGTPSYATNTGWAGNSNTLYLYGGGEGGVNRAGFGEVNHDNNLTTITSINASSSEGGANRIGKITMWADATSSAVTIEKFLVNEGTTISAEINTAWGSDRHFSPLIINEYAVVNEGAASVEVVDTGHNVVINKISGSLSSVHNAGTLTLGSEVNVDSTAINNTGTLILNTTANFETEGLLANIGKLQVANGGSVTINTGETHTLTHTLTNHGSLTIRDEISIAHVNTETFVQKDGCEGTAVEGEFSDGTNGFALVAGAEYYLVTGDGTNLDVAVEEITVDGESVTLDKTTEAGKISFVANRSFDATSPYHVNSGTVNASDVSQWSFAEFATKSGSTLVIDTTTNASELIGNTTGTGNIKIELENASAVVDATDPGIQITGTLDVTKGKLYVGAPNSKDGGDSNAQLLASKIIVRGEGELWTHFGVGSLNGVDSGRTIGADVYLENGAGLKNKDGSVKYTGSIHFNVVNADTETPAYNSGGTVYLHTHWNKIINLNGLINGSGRVEFSASGSGGGSYLALTGNNNPFSGTYAVTSAQSNGIVLGSENAAQYAGIELSGNNSYLQLNQSSTIKALNSANATSIVKANTTAATLTVSEGSFAGKLQDGTNAALSLKKTGSGTLTLSGANTYTGTTTIENGILALATGGEYTLRNSVSGAGTLQVKSGTTLKNDSKAISSDLVLNGGNATLKGDQKVSGNITIKNGSTLTAGQGDVLNYGASMSDFPRTITVEQGGELAMVGYRWSFGRGTEGDENNDANYEIHLAGGTISCDPDVATDTRGSHIDFFDNSSITISGTTGSISANIEIRGKKTLTLKGVTHDPDSQQTTPEKFEAVISGKIIGSGSLCMSGDGTVTLSGANTYGGGTEITGGTLIVTEGSSLGTGDVTVNGGNLEVSGQNAITATNLNITNGTVTANHNPGSDSSVISHSTTVNVNAGGTLKLTGHDMLGWGTNSAPANIVLKGSDENNVATLDIQDTSSFTGVAPIEMKGNSVLTGKIYTTFGQGNITVSAGSNNKITVTEFHARNNVILDIAKDAVLTIESVICNNGNEQESTSDLTKSNVGTLEITNTENTWSEGQLNVTGGTLRLVGAANLPGGVTMSAGTRLETGTGTIGNLTMADGSTLDADTDVKLSGTLTFNGVVNLDGDIKNALYAGEQTVKLFTGITSLVLNGTTYDSTASVAYNPVDLEDVFTFAGLEEDKYQLHYSGGELFATCTVPEPATATLSLLALAGLCARRRRKS